MQWSSWWQKGIGTGAGAQSSHLIHKQRERETHAGNGVRFYFYLFVCLLLAFRDRFSLCSNPNCSGNSSCRASWTWAHRDSPKSACWVLGLKACTTTAQLEWAFITLKPHPVTLLLQEPYLLIPSKQSPIPSHMHVFMGPFSFRQTQERIHKENVNLGIIKLSLFVSSSIMCCLNCLSFQTKHCFIRGKMLNKTFKIYALFLLFFLHFS